MLSPSHNLRTVTHICEIFFSELFQPNCSYLGLLHPQYTRSDSILKCIQIVEVTRWQITVKSKAWLYTNIVISFFIKFFYFCHKIISFNCYFFISKYPQFEFVSFFYLVIFLFYLNLPIWNSQYLHNVFCGELNSTPPILKVSFPKYDMHRSSSWLSTYI